MLKVKFADIIKFSYLIMLGICLPSFSQDVAGTDSPSGGSVQLTIEPALAGTEIDGNFRRYEQYVTPSEGLYLNRFQLFAASAGGNSLLEITGHDSGKASAGESLWGTIGLGKVVLKGSRRNSTFYRDFSDSGQSLSRSDDSLGLDIRTNNSLLRFSYQDVSLAGRGAIPTEDWRQSYSGINYASAGDNWLMRLDYRNEERLFYQGSQFDTRDISYGLTIAPVLADGSTLEANAYFTQTALDNISNEPQRLNVTVEGSHDLPAGVALSGKLFYEELSRSLANGSYADFDMGGQVEADFLGIRHAVVSLGSGIHRVGYINGLQTERINAIQNNSYAKVSYRPSKQLKIKAYTAYDWSDNRPLYDDAFSQTMGSLVWSDKRDNAVEVSFTPNYYSGMSAKWRKSNWNNSDFATHNALIQYDVSAWLMPNEKCTLYGSYLAQNFMLDVPSVTDTDSSHSKTLVSGVSYKLSRPLAVDLAYNVTNVNGVTDQRLHYFSIGANYLTKSGDRWSCTLALDTLDDNVNNNYDYDANRFQVEYSKRLK